MWKKRRNMTRKPIDDENDSPDQPADSDGPADSAAQTAEAPEGNAELQKLQAERDSLYERLVRDTAEFRNAQKRMNAEMDTRLQFANSSLIKSLIPVIDNFERALAVDPEKVDARTILKGMQIVHDQWLKVLNQQQVEEIAPTPGTPFDPTRHEAIMQQDATYPVPTVVQLLQKGYSLHDRTLRPAQVAVSKSVN
jgi:molecular chaperone GrpE